MGLWRFRRCFAIGRDDLGSQIERREIAGDRLGVAHEGVMRQQEVAWALPALERPGLRVHGALPLAVLSDLPKLAALLYQKCHRSKECSRRSRSHRHSRDSTAW